MIYIYITYNIYYNKHIYILQYIDIYIYICNIYIIYAYIYIYIYTVKIIKTNGSTESKTVCKATGIRTNFDFFDAFK